MILILLTLSFLAVFLASGFALIRWAEAYDECVRGKYVFCPVIRREATIQVDPRTAALSALVWKRVLRVTRCDVWPDHQDCHRLCRNQIIGLP